MSEDQCQGTSDYSRCQVPAVKQSSQFYKAARFRHLGLDDGPLLLDVGGAGADEELGHLGDGQHLYPEPRHHTRLKILSHQRLY